MPRVWELSGAWASRLAFVPSLCGPTVVQRAAEGTRTQLPLVWGGLFLDPTSPASPGGFQFPCAMPVGEPRPGIVPPSTASDLVELRMWSLTAQPVERRGRPLLWRAWPLGRGPALAGTSAPCRAQEGLMSSSGSSSRAQHGVARPLLRAGSSSWGQATAAKCQRLCGRWLGNRGLSSYISIETISVHRGTHHRWATGNLSRIADEFSWGRPLKRPWVPLCESGAPGSPGASHAGPLRRLPRPSCGPASGIAPARTSCCALGGCRAPAGLPRGDLECRFLPLGATSSGGCCASPGAVQSWGAAGG